MAQYYGNKIIKKAINSKTGKAWTIDDVPTKWKEATQAYIDAHGGVIDG